MLITDVIVISQSLKIQIFTALLKNCEKSAVKHNIKKSM